MANSILRQIGCAKKTLSFDAPLYSRPNPTKTYLKYTAVCIENSKKYVLKANYFFLYAYLCVKLKSISCHLSISNFGVQKAKVPIKYSLATNYFQLPCTSCKNQHVILHPDSERVLQFEFAIYGAILQAKKIANQNLPLFYKIFIN